MPNSREPTVVGDHRAVFDSFIAAEVRYVNAGGAAAGSDFSQMGAHFHPDIVVHQGPNVPYGGDWHGIHEVERFFAIHSATWETLDLSDVRYFEGEAGVAITLCMRATARRSGRSVDTRISSILTFEDGLIRDFTVFYLDPVQVQTADAG